jgi:hypothetical protein
VELALAVGRASEELQVSSSAEIADLMQAGTQLSFIAKGLVGQLAITFSNDSFLNAAGKKLTLTPYSRSNRRQIFSFRFENCIGAIASHQQYGMVFDVAIAEKGDCSPVYAFMFHGQENQQFEYEGQRLKSVAAGQYVTFNMESGECFLAGATDSPRFAQTFGIINRDI